MVPPNVKALIVVAVKVPLTLRRLLGAVVPIPTLPLFWINKTVASSASPPGDLWKLRVPLFNKLNVAVGAFPVGTTKDKLDEIVAVGFPPAIFINPNFADPVLVAPSKISS